MLLNYKAKGVTDYWNRPVPFQTTPVHYLNFTYWTQKINTLIYLMLFLAFEKMRMKERTFMLWTFSLMYTPSCYYSFTGCIFYLTPVKFKVIPLNVESYLQTVYLNPKMWTTICLSVTRYFRTDKYCHATWFTII